MKRVFHMKNFSCMHIIINCILKLFCHSENPTSLSITYFQKKNKYASLDMAQAFYRVSGTLVFLFKI